MFVEVASTVHGADVLADRSIGDQSRLIPAIPPCERLLILLANSFHPSRGARSPSTGCPISPCFWPATCRGNSPTVSNATRTPKAPLRTTGDRPRPPRGGGSG